MGQDDIYILLKNKRLSGDSSYYSVKDIRIMIRESGKVLTKASVANNIMKLRIFGYLDMKVKGVRYANRSLRPVSVYRLKRSELD